MSAVEHLQDFFQQQSPRMAALADSIWSLAELRYAETASARLHIDALEQAGFRITRGVAGIPTAFLAEWGDEGPVLAFLGEYDALSIGAAIRQAAQQPMPDLSGFHVWFEHVCAGTVSASNMRIDPEGLAQRLMALHGQFKS